LNNWQLIGRLGDWAIADGRLSNLAIAVCLNRSIAKSPSAMTNHTILQSTNADRPMQLPNHPITQLPNT
jgi:hypothetical protein